MTANGDLTLDFSKNGTTSASITASGSSLASSAVTPGVTRSAVWTSYRETIGATGSGITATLDGSVTVRETRLSVLKNVFYSISTINPVGSWQDR